MRLISSLVLAGVLSVSALDVYHVGNSLTDQSYGICGIAESMGEEHGFGRHSIPGAPLEWLWDHRCEGFIAPTGYGSCADDILRNHAWDAVVMQMRQRSLSQDTEDAANYMQVAWSANPDCQAYVFQEYPYPYEANNATSYAALWLDNNAGKMHTRVYYEARADALTEQFPNRKPAFIVPIGEVLYELLTRIENGQSFPGVSHYNDLSKKPDGNDDHFNEKGKYLVAATHYATIYGQSPVGAANEGIKTSNKSWDAGYSVPGDFARAVQELVWEVVPAYSYSGVSSQGTATVPFSIYTGGLRPAQESSPGFSVSGRLLSPLGTVHTAHGITIMSGSTGSKAIISGARALSK